MKQSKVRVKPIETHYDGYKFRSRLEARWAVFFNALGIKFEYELEGYDLGNGLYYLPDFWLPEQDCWVEVKGGITPLASVRDTLQQVSNPNQEKCGRLAMRSKKPLYMVFECLPYKVSADYSHIITRLEGANLYFSPINGYCEGQRALGFCKVCKGYRFGTFGEWCDACDNKTESLNATLYNAYRKARQARFEHSDRRRP